MTAEEFFDHLNPEQKLKVINENCKDLDLLSDLTTNADDQSFHEESLSIGIDRSENDQIENDELQLPDEEHRAGEDEEFEEAEKQSDLCSNSY